MGPCLSKTHYWRFSSAPRPRGNFPGRSRSACSQCFHERFHGRYYVSQINRVDLPVNSKYQIYLKLADINNPSPSMAWVFIDEHPDSINDTLFSVIMTPGASWTDVPASYHNGGGGLSFADGHAEIRHWVDGDNTVCPVLKIHPAQANGKVAVHDIPWLQMRTSSKLNDFSAR